MKKFIHKINKTFENRVRLSIMALLMIHEELSFNQLKEWLEVSDGNLASHIQALEKAEYLIVLKQFIDKKNKCNWNGLTESEGTQVERPHLFDTNIL